MQWWADSCSFEHPQMRCFYELFNPQNRMRKIEAWESLKYTLVDQSTLYQEKGGWRRWTGEEALSGSNKRQESLSCS